MALGGLLVTLVVGSGWAAAAPTATPADARPTPAETRQLWLQACATCHGPEARGTARGVSLQGSGRAANHYMLTTGRMPIADPDDRLVRRPPAYPPATIEALVDYVAVLAPGGPDLPDVGVGRGDRGRGGVLYRQQCAACHAWGGGGGALLERAAPSLGLATPVQTAEAIRVGPGAMPAFGVAALSDAEVADVVAYVSYLRDPTDRGGQPLWHLGPLAEGGLAWVAMGGLLWALRRVGTSA